MPGIQQGLLLVQVQPGSFYLEVPKVGLRLLCGCPPDSIKHLRKLGLVEATEVCGVKTQTGPNAILLADVPAQQGELSNLTEFPTLHMLYLQGMAIPGHPNHGRNKPLLIGKSLELDAQAEYLKRGNYGLYDPQEYRVLGYTPEQTELYLDIKRQFAYGRFIESKELIEFTPFDQDQIWIRGELLIERLALNQFRFTLDQEVLEIDLNLGAEQRYRCAYQLPTAKLPEANFFVTHFGDGDGWDPTRPCLSTLISFHKRLYLIDAGPFVDRNLAKLGLNAHDLSGLFITHVHDDHFGGFYGLVQSNPDLKVFVTIRVFACLMKKYSALSGIREDKLLSDIHYQIMEKEEWNDIQGLLVKPVPSAHPIDTTLLLFKVPFKNGFKSYGHLTDIANLQVLKRLGSQTTCPEEYQKFYQKLVEIYQEPMDLKRVDVGGGPVHGNVDDFANDASGDILWAHTSSPISAENLTSGHQAQFGESVILIP